LNVNFVDNHDVARFLSRGSIAGLKQALLFLLTIPGIPAIYYGTEQAFTETRAAMFANGWESGGADHYDANSELYKHIQALTALRKSSPVYSRGTLTPLADNPAGPSVLAYRRDLHGETAFVIFNTSDQPVLMTNLDTGLPEGTVLELLFGIDNQDDIVAGPHGKIYLTGPFNSWKPNDPTYQFAQGDDGVYRFTLPVDAGATIEYRITRGSFANAEKLDANDRLANRTFFAANDDLNPVTIPIEVTAWWDQ
jgi:hypothetical protein